MSSGINGKDEREITQVQTTGKVWSGVTEGTQTETEGKKMERQQGGKHSAEAGQDRGTRGWILLQGGCVSANYNKY